MTSVAPIPDEMLFRAVDILAKRFCENLSKAFKLAHKRLSSFMEYGPSPYPCPPYQALSRMQIADTHMPKVRLVWAIATDTLLVCLCIYQMIYSHWQKENTITCFGYTINEQNEKVKKLIHSCEKHVTVLESDFPSFDVGREKEFTLEDGTTHFGRPPRSDTGRGFSGRSKRV